MADNNNVVAKLRSDGSVWPTNNNKKSEVANLVNYKIKTEGDIVNKHKLNTTTNPISTAVVDLGKQLLLHAKDSDLIGVRTMLSRGAPFTSDWLGMSALHFAAMNNQYDICDVLIRGGMNKDIKTKVDRTPLHFATYYGHERIVEMLLSRKCAVNPKDMLRMTPLHWAIERRHKNIVRMLLKYNADVNVVTKFNKTPIGIAVLTEQPDILAELQVAKAEQTKKKFNEEQEKEISDAVGTILAEVSEQIDSKSNIELLDVDVEDNSSSMRNITNSQTINFDRIQDTAVLDKNAINLLKSHGISMMQEEDEDGSKDLLSTALQNGRQLVLSEGGKMLLNETRQQKLIQSCPNMSVGVAAAAAAQQKTFNSNNNNNNKQNNPVPKQQQQQQQQQMSAESIAKNNVRIVSYKEFQNMFYNNADGKSVDKPTPTMSNMRIIRQQIDGAVNLSNSVTKTSIDNLRNSLTNNSKPMQLTQQHRQMKITPMKHASTTATTTPTPTTRTGTMITTVQSGQQQQQNTTINESNDLSDIIQILPSEIENEISDINNKNLQSRLGFPPVNSRAAGAAVNSSQNENAENTTTSTSANAANSVVPVCFIAGGGGTRRIEASNRSAQNTQSSIRQVNVIKRPHPQQQSQQIKMPATTTSMKGGGVGVGGGNAQVTTKPAPNVMPLLSTPEICRQLHEMRKQNEDLKRRMDLLQKEKDEMRQRLDRLEELFYVERTDEESAYEIES